jgi:DNA polymerase-1
MIKIAMIGIHQDIKDQKLGSKMTMQVHDELVFDVIVNETEIMKKIIIDRMKNAIKMEVPILVEVGVGRNWLEAH